MFDFACVEDETHQTASADLFSHATTGHTLWMHKSLLQKQA